MKPSETLVKRWRLVLIKFSQCHHASVAVFSLFRYFFLFFFLLKIMDVIWRYDWMWSSIKTDILFDVFIFFNKTWDVRRSDLFIKKNFEFFRFACKESQTLKIWHFISVASDYSELIPYRLYIWIKSWWIYALQLVNIEKKNCLDGKQHSTKIQFKNLYK